MKQNKGRNILCALIAMLVFFYGSGSCLAAGEEAADENSYSGAVTINSPDAENEDEKPSSQIKYRDHFSFDVRILTYGIIQEPAESSQNPGNNLINLPHYIANLEVRPDVYFNSSVVDISAKPRAKLYFRAWEEGDLKGETKWDDDWYVNEWLVRIKAGDRLFVSYGRENLQWGPSFLYSPSNPFFSDNGRSNPYMEIPGMDFGRLIFIPHRFWTISLIVNTDEGRNILPGPDPFVNTYAVKIDFTGRQNYASLILSQRDDKNYNPVLGFFGGWTVSDAILLYGEGSLTKGSQALYPQRNILWASMQRIHGDDSDIKPVLLAGGSYTFYNGGALTLEYMHNAPGYNKDEADLYYEFRRDAACLFNMGGIAGFIGKYFLSQTGNPGLRFLRKNYVMLQYYHGNIKDKFDMTLRWTQNIDDGSGQFLGLLSYSAGNHWALFSSGAINVGNADTEFGSILNYQFMLGLKFVF
jgi:hypothetical protein